MLNYDDVDVGALIAGMRKTFDATVQLARTGGRGRF